MQNKTFILLLFATFVLPFIASTAEPVPKSSTGNKFLDAAIKEHGADWVHIFYRKGVDVDRPQTTASDLGYRIFKNREIIGVSISVSKSIQDALDPDYLKSHIELKLRENGIKIHRDNTPKLWPCLLKFRVHGMYESDTHKDSIFASCTFRVEAAGAVALSPYSKFASLNVPILEEGLIVNYGKSNFDKLASVFDEDLTVFMNDYLKAQDEAADEARLREEVRKAKRALEAEKPAPLKK